MMRNAESLTTVHTRTHTNSLNAIKLALFSVDKNKYCKLKANKLV